MQREKFAVLIVVSGLAAVAVFAMHFGTRIDQYQPKTRDESQIIRLLICFQQARRAHDLDAYLSCLDDGGQFMFAGSIMVSKEELRALLPSFWAGLEKGGLDAVPSSREELSGNYFDGTFYDPIMTVNKNRAKAAVTFVTPVARWRTTLFLELEKFNRSWKITRLEWDMG